MKPELVNSREDMGSGNRGSTIMELVTTAQWSRSASTADQQQTVTGPQAQVTGRPREPRWNTTRGRTERARGARSTFDARSGTSSTRADPQPKTKSCEKQVDKPTMYRRGEIQLQHQLNNTESLAKRSSRAQRWWG